MRARLSVSHVLVAILVATLVALAVVLAGGLRFDRYASDVQKPANADGPRRNHERLPGRLRLELRRRGHGRHARRRQLGAGLGLRA